MMRPILILAAAALLQPMAAFAAESTESRLRDALRTVNGQLQALQEEQAKWQAAEAKYKKDLDSLREELAASRRLARTQSAAQASKKEYEEKLAALNQSLAQCQKEGQEAQQAARGKEDERMQMVGKLDGLTARAAACEAKNSRLYRVGQDILDWLGRVGFGAALMAREPFLGIKRVELENIAQDYQDKLLDQKITPAPPR